MNELKTIIQLKRQPLSQYDPNRIIRKGEVCIVEDGGRVRFKIGDGIKNFLSLPYIEEISGIIYRGYYFNNKFWVDSSYTTELEKSQAYLYIDKIVAGTMYTWDGEKFNPVITTATESAPGTMKLYQGSGTNTDGTMTQKSITEGIQNIKFSIAEDDNECLVLELPW